MDYYNRIQKREILGKILKKESDLVKTDSMEVLKDFEEIEYKRQIKKSWTFANSVKENLMIILDLE